MDIFLTIVSNILLVAFIVFTMIFERKNGLLAIAKTILFAGAIVGAYFLTPIVLPLIKEIIVAIDITSKLVFSGVLALIALIEFLIITLIIFAIRRAVIKKRIKPAKPQLEKIKTRKIQSKEKEKEEIKLKKAKKKEIIKKFKVHKGKQIVGLIFGFISAILVVFTLHFPFKFLIKEVVDANPELEIEYLKVITEYTPFGQLDNILDIDKLLE